MASVPSYFDKFLRGIRPTTAQTADYVTGHTTLRDRLNAYDDFKGLLVTDFIQGSYRRSTAVRPKGDKRADVDVVVVTRMSAVSYPDPDDAMDHFEPFLEKFYEGKYERQGRSFGIELSYVDLDLVITSAPSESDENILTSAAVKSRADLEEAPDWMLKTAWVPPKEREYPGDFTALKAAREEPEWSTEPLLIPARDVGGWVETHPLEQIKWAAGKNARCNKHYVNVVKAIKWWRRLQEGLPDYPKGYPLEHLIGHCCPDSIDSVAEGVTLTFESIRDEFAQEAANKEPPELKDHGVEQDVFERVSGEDFAALHARVSEAAFLAREAFEAETRESVLKWGELFGNKFPPPSSGKSGGSGPEDDPGGPFVSPGSGSTSGDYAPRRWGMFG